MASQLTPDTPCPQSRRNREHNTGRIRTSSAKTPVRNAAFEDFICFAALMERSEIPFKGPCTSRGRGHYCLAVAARNR